MRCKILINSDYNVVHFTGVLEIYLFLFLSLRRMKNKVFSLDTCRLLITRRLTKTNVTSAQENSEEKNAEMSVTDAKLS